MEDALVRDTGRLEVAGTSERKFRMAFRSEKLMCMCDRGLLRSHDRVTRMVWRMLWSAIRGGWKSPGRPKGNSGWLSDLRNSCACVIVDYCARMTASRAWYGGCFGPRYGEVGSRRDVRKEIPDGFPI